MRCRAPDHPQSTQCSEFRIHADYPIRLGQEPPFASSGRQQTFGRPTNLPAFFRHNDGRAHPPLCIPTRTTERRLLAAVPPAAAPVARAMAPATDGTAIPPIHTLLRFFIKPSCEKETLGDARPVRRDCT